MNTQSPAILLIEKDEVTLEIYQRELSKSFTVFAYTDIDGVLESVINHDIRAVVIEPEICSGQGWELIDSIQRNYPTRFIPVIVCSTRDASREGPGNDVAKYLTKPVLPKTLREKTLEVLGLRETPRKSS
jgi:DNA-binding response OmpR family regulator